jgi:cathepsin F
MKELFDNFKQTHSRSYATQEEENRRFGIFAETLKIVDQRNAADRAAGGSAVHGITRFADLTQDEFASMYLDSRTSRYIRQRNATVVALPKGLTSGAVDYTGKQTTAIKDQGNCGSCW